MATAFDSVSSEPCTLQCKQEELLPSVECEQHEQQQQQTHQQLHQQHQQQLPEQLMSQPHIIASTSVRSAGNNSRLLCQPSPGALSGEVNSSGLRNLTECSVEMKVQRDDSSSSCNTLNLDTSYHRPPSMSSIMSAVVTPVPVIPIDDEGPPPPVGTIQYLQRCQRARRREEQIKRLEEQRLQEIIAFCEEYNRESDIYFEQLKRTNPCERKYDPKYIFSPKKGPNYSQNPQYESTYGDSLASTIPSTSTYSFAPYSTSLNKSEEGPMDLSKSGGWSTDSVTSNSSSPSSSTVTGHTLPSAQSSYVNSMNRNTQRVMLHSSFSPGDSYASHLKEKAHVHHHPDEDVTNTTVCRIKSTVSSETLYDLKRESALLQSEIDSLRECKPDDSGDFDNESLKEFQLMERECRLTELTKCLERIKEQIECKRNKSHSKVSSAEGKTPLPAYTTTHIDKDREVHAFIRTNASNGSFARSSLKKSKILPNFNESDDDDDEDDASDTLTETEDNSSDSGEEDTPRLTLSGVDHRKASSLPPSDLYSLHRNVHNNMRAFSVKPSHSVSSNDSSARAMTSTSPRHSHSAKSGLIGEMVIVGHNLSVFTSDDVQLTCCTCSGYLWKLTSNKKKWKKRFFHFDRHHRVFFYYKNIDQFRKVKKPNGGVIFADLRDVWIDRSNGHRDSPRKEIKSNDKQITSPISPLARSNSLMRASFRSLKHATLGRRNKKKDDQACDEKSEPSQMSKSSENILSSASSIETHSSSRPSPSQQNGLPPLHPGSPSANSTRSNNNIFCKSNNSPLNKLNNNNINNKNNHTASPGAHHSFVFVVDTSKRSFVLSSHSWQLMRLWIDVIFTGVDSYCD